MLVRLFLTRVGGFVGTFVARGFSAALLAAALLAFAQNEVKAGSAQTGSGSSGDLAKLQTIVSSMQPGEWRQLPNSKAPFLTREEHEAIVAAHPGSRGFWGNQGPNGAIRAYNSAGYDPTEHRWYFTGGGHKDYGGNEVYQFDFKTLQWSRLNDPSPISSDSHAPLEGPIARHTYDSTVWNPTTKTLWMFGLYGYNASGNNPVEVRDLIWEFDPVVGKWRSITPGAWSGPFTQATYNPATGRIWGFQGAGKKNKALEYGPDGKAYNVGSATFAYRINDQLDTAKGKMYLFSRGDTPRPAITEITLTDSSGFSGVTLQKEWPQELQDISIWERGIAYHPPSDQFVLWGGGGDIWTWSFQDQQIRRHDILEGDLPPQANRFWDQWIYIPEADVFAGYVDPKDSVWIYKLDTSSDVIVDPNEPRAKIGDTMYKSIDAAFSAAKDGETITILPGSWREAAILRANSVTVEATGAHFYGVVAENKAAIVVKGNDLTINGLECSQVGSSNGNGACIRQEGANLTLRNVHFHDAQQGVLANDRTGYLHIEDSVFERLGHGGRAHGIYINASDALVVRNSRFLASQGEGHEIKSRSAKTIIENNVIASLDGRDSRLLDLPNGGEIVIRNNVLEQGPNSANQDLIGIGLEIGKRGEIWPVNSTLIEGNMIIIDSTRSTLLNWKNVAAPVVVGNAVVGGSQSQVPEDNTWFPQRSDAGLAPYPYLPETADSRLQH